MIVCHYRFQLHLLGRLNVRALLRIHLLILRLLPTSLESTTRC